MKKVFSYLLLGVALATASIGSANAAAMSNYLQNKLVDHMFRNQAYTMPAVLCVALTTSTPTAASTGANIAEVTYTGYSRGQLNPAESSWLGTANETVGPSAGNTGTTRNNTTITIGAQATSGPTVVTSFAILDSCTAGTGNVLFYANLTNSKTINSGDPAPIFGVNSLTVQLQ